MSALSNAGTVIFGTLTVALGIALSAQDPLWFRNNIEKTEKGKPPRFYEGLLDQPNGKPEYELIGFFAFDGKREALSKDGPELHALYFVPNAVQRIFVQAKQISSRTNYLLLSKPDSVDKAPNRWNDLHWKTKPVIAPNHINPDRLGVVVRLDSEDAQHGDLAPVIFCMKPKGQRIANYELLFKIQRYSLASLYYRIVGPITKTCFYSLAEPCLPKAPKVSSGIEVGTVISLPFPLESPAGAFTIEIHGQYKDSLEKLEPSFNFYHQPTYASQ